MTGLEKARLIALVMPSALLGGAIGSQYIGGLHPCEMCYWQRWPHLVAILFALTSLALRGSMPDKGRSLVWLAGLAVLISGLIGVYHAGVEAGVFQGITQCSSGFSGGSAEDVLAQIMSTPLIRCDQIQWSFLGISMAGWNAILSIASALAIAWFSLRRPRPIA